MTFREAFLLIILCFAFVVTTPVHAVALGTSQITVTCHATGTVTSDVCPAGTYLKVMDAYVIDTTSQEYIDSLATPYDYVKGAALWAWGFSFIITLALSARSAGIILEFIRAILR